MITILTSIIIKYSDRAYDPFLFYWYKRFLFVALNLFTKGFPDANVLLITLVMQLSFLLQSVYNNIVDRYRRHVSLKNKIGFFLIGLMSQNIRLGVHFIVVYAAKGYELLDDRICLLNCPLIEPILNNKRLWYGFSKLRNLPAISALSLLSFVY